MTKWNESKPHGFNNPIIEESMNFETFQLKFLKRLHCYFILIKNNDLVVTIR